MLNMVDKPKTPGQLAFEALEYVTVVPGNPVQIRRQVEAGGTTIIEAAELFGLSPDMLHDARKLLKTGTPEEIAAVKAGEMSIHSALLGEKHRNTAVKDRGKNPERLEAYRLESHVWQQLRVSVEALAALPAQADVVKIARKKKSTAAIVDRNLSGALTWLKGFDHAWNDREEAQNRDDHLDAGDGDQTPRE